MLRHSSKSLMLMRQHSKIAVQSSKSLLVRTFSTDQSNYKQNQQSNRYFFYAAATVAGLSLLLNSQNENFKLPQPSSLFSLQSLSQAQGAELPPDEENAPESGEPLFNELNLKNLESEMELKKPRFIYFFRGNQKELNEIANFVQKLNGWQGVRAYIVDMRKHENELVRVLSKRNPGKANDVREMLQENKFMFTNRFSDIEFFDDGLVFKMDSDRLKNFQNFILGPQVIDRLEDIVINQQDQNDVAVVLYEPESCYEPDSKDNMRAFRKYHTINMFESLHLKYFIVRDPKIAKQLGITKPRTAYAIRPAENSQILSDSQKANIRICDYDYLCTPLLSQEELSNRPSKAVFNKISDLVMNSPIFQKRSRVFLKIS